jgi:hypothetical protein
MARRPISNSEKFWKEIEDEFAQVEGALRWHQVETKEEAIAGTLRFDEYERSYRGNPGVFIRYRGTNVDYDSREYYLNEGRKLLDTVEKQIEGRQFTTDFVLNWGRISVCRGFIEAYILDDTDGVSHLAAGQRSGQKRNRDPQRHWVARLLQSHLDSGATRRFAEARAEKRVSELVDKPPAGFSREWFSVILKGGALVSTYRQKKLPEAEVRRLAAEPIEGLPPI